MVLKQYNIVFYGEIVEGYSVEDVRHNLASQFKLDPETREQLFSGKSVIIREHVDYMAASALQTTCELQGGTCHVELAQVDTQYGSIDVSKLCNVEFCGEITIGHRIEDVKKKLRTRLKTNCQTIEQLFTGKPIVIKRDVDHQTALHIQSTFEQAGAICRITASDKSLPQDKALQEKIFLPENLDMMICPKCGLRQPVSSTCMQCSIVVQKFVKKKRAAVKREPPQKTVEAPQEGYAEEEAYEDVEAYDEEVVEEEEIGPKEIPIWQIGLVGNVIFTLLMTLFGVSFYKIMVPFSLRPDLHSVDVEYKNVFALLFSNVRVAGLIGSIFPIVMFFRKTLHNTKIKAFRYVFVAVLLNVIGAAVVIDIFVILQGGFPFVTVFGLKAIGLSAIAYVIGFGCFLVIRRGELTTPLESEEPEAFEEEETEALDGDETDSFDSDETDSDRMG